MIILIIDGLILVYRQLLIDVRFGAVIAFIQPDCIVSWSCLESSLSIVIHLLLTSVFELFSIIILVYIILNF
jgi:hypothetical protein